jgi:hypothetical protein
MDIVKVANLDDLVLPKDGTVDLLRGDAIFSLPIRALTGKEFEAISKAHNPPNAPKMWRPKTGGASGEMESYKNYDDPTYMAEVEQANEDKVKSYILTALVIDIPGSTIEERWDALSSKLLGGEWKAIWNAINELSNALGRVAAEAKNSSPLPSEKEKTEG